MVLVETEVAVQASLLAGLPTEVEENGKGLGVVPTEVSLMSFLPIRHTLERAQELEDEALKPHDSFKFQQGFVRAEDPNKDLQCKANQMPQADTDEIRRVLSKYFPPWRVNQILQETCPYCGCVTPREFKIYRHPKDLDCIGIYTCDNCGKRWVKDGKIHAEVW